MFVHQKDNPQKPPAKVKRTREEMQTTMQNIQKVVANSPRSALKKKKKVEGGTLGSIVRREHESINLKAHKMMKGIMEPSTMPIVVQVIIQTTTIPHMTFPHERQPRE
jgi:hypothetical protein